LVVTLNVTVYGFGSSFGKFAAALDVDLLVVHSSTDASSCDYAIQCKRHLAEQIGRAHVTMLSASENTQFEFIRRSRALDLGTLRKDHLEADLQSIIGNICRLTLSLPV